MRRNLSWALFATSTLLFPSIGMGQINTQPGSMPDIPISAPGNRNPSDLSSSNTGLRVVPENFEKLSLAPGFLVKLNVLDDSDFSGEYRIDDDGNIAVPVLGMMHIAGLTAAEARQSISKRLLDNQLLKDPQVNFSIIEYTAPQVTIIGEVNAPGKYPLLVPTDLVRVLTLAGGPNRLAGNEVQITPGSGDSKPVLVHYSKASDPKSVEDVVIHPGDTVQVKRAGIVYVLGAVNRPGGYVMQEEGTLNILQAISLANGTATTASTGTIYVLRRNPDGTEIIMDVPLKKISRGQQQDRRLYATDVIYVPTSKVKSIFTNSQAVLSAAASASIYAAY